MRQDRLRRAVPVLFGLLLGATATHAALLESALSAAPARLPAGGEAFSSLMRYPRFPAPGPSRRHDDGSAPLAADTPYTEFIPLRFAGDPAKATEGWGVAPGGLQDVATGIVESSPAGTRVDAQQPAPRTFLLSADGIFSADWAAGTVASAFSNVSVSGSALRLPAVGGRLVTDGTAGLVGVATPTGYTGLSCSVTVPVTCSVTGSVAAAFGNVSDVVVVGEQVVVAAKGGLFYVEATGSGTATRLLTDDSMSTDMGAVAYHESSSLLAAGNAAKLWLFDTSKPGALTLFRWEWVTQISTGAGGVVDDNITALAFDSAGVLYIGNPTCLNVRFTNASVTRIAGLEGLPYGNISSISVGFDAAGRTIVWIGTSMGLIRYDPSGDRDVLGDAFQYFYGPRWHPGAAVLRVAAGASGAPVPAAGAVLGTPGAKSVASPVLVAVTDGGLVALAEQPWTLAAKAEFMDAIRARHDRHGLVAECYFNSFGNLSSCHSQDSDNNGLWTSLVVGAEAFRFAVEKSDAAEAAAERHFGAMKFLNDVTGIKGLMARSFVVEGTTTHGGTWHNSTAFPGWTWKGDTSSDEVSGHMFCYPLVAQLLRNATIRQDAVTLMANIAAYITDNDFTLVDVTGMPTTWGHWDPKTINNNRSWSDERGVNANQMLAFLSAAYNATSDKSFSDAYAMLTNATNQYHQNCLNLKIEAPCDDNYSDDELTFLPYFTALTTSDNPDWVDPIFASMDRTFRHIQSLRSDLWGAMYLATTGYSNQTIVDDIMWNLRTWPLELIEWPMQNSHRHDIRFDPNTGRFGRSGTDNVRILPCHERNQLRWNGNPHDLDGGGGTSEGDPGAWLLPYWLSRYYNIVGAPTEAL